MKNIIFVLFLILMIASCSKKDETITQMVKFTVKPEHVVEFRKAQVNSLNHSLEEEGNIEMKLYSNDKNPYTFYVYSKWKDEEVYELHKTLPHSKNLAPLFKEALKEKPEIIRLEDTGSGHIDSKALISTGNEQAIFIHFTVKEGYADRVVEQFEKHTVNSRKEAGNIFFDFYKVKGKENAFYVYENWKNSPEVLENHANQVYVGETMSLLDEAAVGELEDGVTLATEYDEKTLNESYTLEKIWGVENVIMPESISSNPDDDFVYVSVVNTQQKEGFINRYTKEGKLDTEKWVKGINTPTGKSIHKGKMYVVDLTQVHVIDIASSKIIKTLPTEAKSLNDISMGNDGIGYISDLRTGDIYRLKDDVIELWLQSDTLPTANGVLVDGDHLIVGTLGDEVSTNLKPEQYGSLYNINISNKSINLIKPSERIGAIDGVVKFKKGFIISDPLNGKIFYVDYYKKELMYDAAGVNADIDIDSKGNVLYVPGLFDNKIAAYKIVKNSN